MTEHRAASEDVRKLALRKAINSICWDWHMNISNEKLDRLIETHIGPLLADALRAELDRNDEAMARHIAGGPLETCKCAPCAAMRGVAERVRLEPRGLAKCHVVPEQSDIEANRSKEPERERIRQELIDFLERNKICGILLYTPHHHVDIQYCPLLPDEIHNVLSLRGSIYIVVKERALAAGEGVK